MINERRSTLLDNWIANTFNNYDNETSQFEFEDMSSLNETVVAYLINLTLDENFDGLYGPKDLGVTFFYYYYLTVIVVGIPLNLIWSIVFMIWRRPHRIWQYLLATALSDASALIAAAGHYIKSSYWLSTPMTWLCRTMHFLVNTNSTFSSFIWVIMSIDRCTHIVKPYWDVSNGQACNTSRPFVILITLVVSSLLQVWTIKLFKDQRLLGCHVPEDYDPIIMTINAIDFVLSYVAPLIIILGANVLVNYVAFYQKNTLLSPQMKEIRRRKRYRSIRRLVGVALLDVTLNLPNQCIRLLGSFGIELPLDNPSWLHAVQLPSYALLYSQYLLNVAYFHILFYGQLIPQKCYQSGHSSTTTQKNKRNTEFSGNAKRRSSPSN